MRTVCAMYYYVMYSKCIMINNFFLLNKRKVLNIFFHFNILQTILLFYKRKCESWSGENLPDRRQIGSEAL